MKILLKNVAVVIIFCLLYGITNAQTPNWNWAKSGRGAGHDYGNSISTDAYGNCYSTGYFQVPSIVFGADTLTGSLTYHDGFYLVKYDSSGNEIWARYAGDENNAYGTCVNTDAVGNSYVTGYFQGSGIIHFGSYNLTAPGSTPEGFVAKYDSSGNVLWVKLLGPLSGSSMLSISNGIDSNGNVYVTGNSDSPMTSTLNFIQKFDTSGNLIWQKTATGNFRTPSIATDANGNSYITGCFFSGSTMTFGSHVITNASSGWIIFIVKYDSSGNVIWAKSDGTYASLYTPTISVDAIGNSYVTGYFNGPYAKFGSTTLTNAGLDDIFIVKYDSLGNSIWAKRAGGPDYDEATCIKTDAAGNSYLTGMFKSTAFFGSTSLTSVGGNDIFAAKYDSAGTVSWVKRAGGNNPDCGNGICLDQSGNNYITGYFFSSHLAFGGGLYLSNSDTIYDPAEVFIAKLNDLAITTGIPEENNSLNTITIFPNPYSSQTTININKELKNATLGVYNLTGQELKEIKNISGYTISLDRENLSNGFYFFRLMENNKIITSGKLIVTD